jgi:hypothetical protein
MAWWNRKQEPEPATTLTQVLDRYELVEVLDEGTVLVAERGPKQLVAPSVNVDVRELGSASPGAFSQAREYNAQLRGWNGIRKYDEMRRSDSSIQGVLDLVKTPVLGGRWYIEPYSDYDKEPTARDMNAARHVWWNLTDGMTTSWPQFLSEALLMLDYGYYCFEKVYTLNNPLKPGMACWQKFSPRHPGDIIDFDYDKNGGPNGIRIMSSDTLRDGSAELPIPIKKLLVFTHKKEGGDMMGQSYLRAAFKPWYMKAQLEKIDAIQKERHGIGVPIIKLPVNFSKEDRAIAENLGRNLRTNERAHIVLPPGWEILFAKLEGQMVNTLESIRYHDGQIWTRALARFMTNTNANVKDDDRILFLQATRFIANTIVEVINKYAIPELVDYNWLRIKGYPKLCVRRIGEQADWRTLSFALRNLAGANMLTPDERLEEELREEMDLPRMDPETQRKMQTPQAPGAPQTPQAPEAGPPRQGPPSAKPPAANGGRDASGGK